MPEHAYLSESTFVQRHAPRRQDGTAASTIREAISRVNELDSLRAKVTNEYVVWSVTDTTRAFVTEQGQSNAALGYFLARAQNADQPVRAILNDSSYCVLWHEIDSTQQAFVTSAYNAGDARQRFLDEVHALLGSDAELNVDFFLEKTFVISLTATGPFDLQRVTDN